MYTNAYAFMNVYTCVCPPQARLDTLVTEHSQCESRIEALKHQYRSEMMHAQNNRSSRCVMTHS